MYHVSIAFDNNMNVLQIFKAKCKEFGTEVVFKNICFFKK